ncbi:hypothetical protein SDC9_211141 [bioreactor metagenome]|uniref:Uncharacterized protein n=2 Tax=root TaxID=1 RepID=A0A645JW03_9ZZZZ
MNSSLGFLSTMGMVKQDWNFLLIFSGLAIVGIFVGIAISKRMDGTKLKPLFGWIVLGMGIFIIIKEIFLQ